MSIFRSQTVERFKLYLPRQSAWNIMDHLGQRELIHVIPTRSDQTIRHFTHQVKRIQEALLKVSRFQDVLLNKKMTEPLTHIDQQQISAIYNLFKSQNHEQHHKNSANYANSLIENIDELWEYYSQVSKRLEMLQKEIQNSRENIAILLAGQKQYGRSFFTNQNSRYNSYDKANYYSANKINYKAGVINISTQLRFKRSLFRISKGNCLVMTKQLSDIFDDLQPKEKQKVVFFVIYPANNQNYFDSKINKIISIFSDRTFDHFSHPLSSFQDILANYKNSNKEALSLKEMCQNELQSFLYEKLLEKVNKNKKVVVFSQLKKYEFLKLYLLKERQIYLNLNEMEIYNHFFQAQIFIRKQDVKQVQKILNYSQVSRELPPGNIVPIVSHQKHPTSFVLNDFTRPAQQIVETYGVPRYKEINPSIFTIITFPFLFGVMFGDIGHGSILLALGAWLIWKQPELKKMQNFMLNMVLPYRYLIGLMGFFAVYCGIIYNDFISISLNIFGSCYEVENTIQTEAIDRISSDCVYPFGLDPVWSVAENNLNFTNSLKMKISVIIGVIHMILGVFLKFMNDLYFKNYKEIIFVFTSQLAFLVVLFGYMDFLIIYKWLTPWVTERDTSMAPSIITQIIDIPLSMGSTSGKPLWNQQSQENLQFFLLLIAGIAIPLMFFPVPLMKIFKIERRNNKNKKGSARKPKYLNSSDMEMQINEMLIDKEKQINYEENDEKQIHAEEQSPSQILVHQSIETIEFVLGCVSNTASYLRLWALSLAHSQLSEVFFQKTVQHSLSSGWSGIPMNLIGFTILASTTTGIMLLMDTMECFLHTLRLHWVEFQNKFYKADGFLFKNYNFRLSINQELKKSSF